MSVHHVKPSADEIRKRIVELLAENPDLIITGGGTTTALLLQATAKIPIVFTTAVDPVGNGFVESLSHPGRNATGFMQFDYSLSGKWLELLKQVSSTVVRVGIVRDAATPSGIGQFAVLQSVAASFGVDIFPIGTTAADEIESGIARLANAPNAGLIATLGAGVNAHRDHIVQLAALHRLPSVYANRVFVDRGGLISYGSDTIASTRRAASYVDRILKGEKPADLPVQAPNKVRAGGQSEDRQGAWFRSACNCRQSGGRGDRIRSLTSGLAGQRLAHAVRQFLFDHLKLR